GIRDLIVTGVQTCALPISAAGRAGEDNNSLRLRDRFVEEFLRGTLQPQSLQVGDDFPVIENSYDDTFKFMFELRGDNRHDGDARSEERRVGKECGCGWERE